MSIVQSEIDRFPLEMPWPIPKIEECQFYHSMDFPDGESVTGHWDIRGKFDQYIGYYPISGKTLLDVGSSSGFAAFSAERQAGRVTALDYKHVSELDFIPFQFMPYQKDNRAAWELEAERATIPIKKVFWYAWHKHHSQVEMIYAPLRELKYWDRKFDIVIAGAILEHLADPVSVIGALARLATEALIIAFTPMEDTNELSMRTVNDWSDPASYFSWWTLSRGLYERVFTNLGFTVEYASAVATDVAVNKNVTRPTIIARRRHADPPPNTMPQRLYQACFGREPALGGAHVDLLSQNMPLEELAFAFAGTEEFQDRCGSLSDREFVTLLYQSVLRREPDASGLEGWLELLSSGKIDRLKVLMRFSESIENLSRLSKAGGW